ncbi:hypothetical protein E2C01_042433 [Portunus trituberculatus]|uniref:Uncharacterized protein n=1 Tax=Portunus trituberculatus TaxID=210409 RepID=A0A5B7FQ81_PORTR|nr:hypothetical protein [Portunus trituberculatus]
MEELSIGPGGSCSLPLTKLSHVRNHRMEIATMLGRSSSWNIFFSIRNISSSLVWRRDNASSSARQKHLNANSTKYIATSHHNTRSMLYHLAI